MSDTEDKTAAPPATAENSDPSLVTNGGQTAVQVDPAQTELVHGDAGTSADDVAHVDAPAADAIKPAPGLTADAQEASGGIHEEPAPGAKSEIVEPPAPEHVEEIAEDHDDEHEEDEHDDDEHALVDEPVHDANDQIDNDELRDRIVEMHNRAGLVPPATAKPTAAAETEQRETGVVADGCVVTTEDGTFHPGEKVTVSASEVARLRKLGKLEPASTTH